MLRAASEAKPEEKPVVSRLVVEHNFAHNLTNWLVEAQPGLVQRAISRDSSFDWELSEGSAEDS